MRAWLLAWLFVVACGASARHTTYGPLDTARPVAAGHGMLHVVVTDNDGHRAVGATAVVTSPSMAGEFEVVTDDAGQGWQELAPGMYKVIVYFNDAISNVDVELKPAMQTNIAIAIPEAKHERSDCDPKPGEMCL